MARRPINSPFTITTEFGVPDSYAKFGKHSGVDYAVPAGRPIYAPTSGQLENVVSPTGGNMVVIKANGLTHRLMHNSAFSRGNGWVNEGDQVATAGTTGLSTGVHSHWDINKEGTYPTSFASFISPADWLAGKYNVITPPSGGGNNMFANDQEIIEFYQSFLNRTPVASEVAGWRGQSKQRFAQVAKAEVQSVHKQLADVKTALANEKAKPPKEVIKIVEKIVDRPVEVIKEVPAPVDEKQVVTNVLVRFWNSLFKKG